MTDDATIKDEARRAGWVNRAHAGAFRRGWLAREALQPRDACPYRVARGGGVLNGTFAWPRAWRDGWDSCDAIRAAFSVTR